MENTQYIDLFPKQLENDTQYKESKIFRKALLF